MKMYDLRTKDVLTVILEVAQSIKHGGSMFNERYLHHFFSHLLQEKYNILDLTGDNRAITLHPEWPTYKEESGITFRRYKKTDEGIYKPNANGTAGFIDFAIGDYNKPDIGIELLLEDSWSNEAIVFDFVKLLDKKIPFNVSISFYVIFRIGKLVRNKRLKDLEKKMNVAFIEAVNRLNGEVCDNSREIYFIVTEIDKDNNRRHWHYDITSGRFENGLPVIA